MDELSLKSGAEFDKAYADLMVKDHKEDVDEFKKESEKGNDPELRAWAGETLPTLEHHLKMAESNADALKQ
jgi:putative membrane protein